MEASELELKGKVSDTGVQPENVENSNTTNFEIIIQYRLFVTKNFVFGDFAILGGVHKSRTHVPKDLTYLHTREV